MPTRQEKIDRLAKIERLIELESQIKAEKATKKKDVPWSETIGAATGAMGESFVNTIKRIALAVSGQGLWPQPPEDTRKQERAEGLRSRQTFGQNLAAGAIGLSPYLVPVAGQALFAGELASKPEDIPALLEQFAEHGRTTTKALYGGTDLGAILENFFRPGQRGDPEAIETLRQQPIEHLTSAAIALGAVKGGGMLVRKGKVQLGRAKPLEQLSTGVEPGPVIAEPLPKKAVAPKPVTLGSGPFNPDVAKALGGNVVSSMRKISSTTSEMLNKAKEKPEIKRGVSEAKETMIEHDRQIRRAESTAQLLDKTFADAVPNKDRQMLIIHAVQQKRNPRFYDKLTPQEKGVVQWMELEFDKLTKFNKEHQIVTEAELPEGIRYVKGWWKNPKTGKPYASKYGKIAKALPEAKKKKYLTYEAGQARGLELATTNLGRILGEGWQSLMRAHQSRQMFKSLAKIEGEKNISILGRGKAPRQIRLIEQWDKLKQQGLEGDYVRATDMGPNSRMALAKEMVIKTADGNTIRIGQDVGVHKNLAPFVRAYIENPKYGKLMDLNFASKSLKLGMSLFHPAMLGWQELANWRIPFKNIPRGLRLRKQLGPEVRLLHQEGLELFKGYEDLGYRNQFFDGVNLGGKIGNAVTKPISMMRDFIFEVVQPGMKVSFAHDKFNRLLPKYLKGTKWTPEAVMEAFEAGRPLPKEALRCARDVVRKADGHFSGEHYKRSLLETNRWMVKLYFSPEARKAWQATLLSPTWQREHMLVAKDVMKSFVPDRALKKMGLREMGPIRRDYQKYLAAGIMIVGAVDMYNYMATQEMDGTGKHLWENPKGKGFAVRAWWDEPGGKKAYVRPLKSLFEVAEWGKDPFRKFSYKVAPWVSAVIDQFSDSRYRKPYEGVGDTPRRIFDFTREVATPIQAEQIWRTYQGKQSIYAGTLPFFGFPVSSAKSGGAKTSQEYKRLGEALRKAAGVR